MKRTLAFLCLAVIAVITLAICPTPAWANEYSSKSLEGAKVYLISPQNGETVPSTFTVKFGLSGMGVAPAGIDKNGTGHHHLLVDLDALPDLDESLAVTENIKHFGGGQTETTLSLPPGKHTLQLLLANYVHIPHDPPVLSDPITITVED